MSSIVSSLPTFDLKRTLAHVFPGFLLYVGLLLATDAFMFKDKSTFTSLMFTPSATDIDTLVSVIGIGIFVGSILGVMIDGIGHWLFEDKWFQRIVRRRKLSNTLTIGQAEDKVYSFWRKTLGITNWNIKNNEHVPDPTFPEDADFFYPFTYKSDDDEDKVKLKDQLISEYYSYFEFYLNSAISLSIISIVIPFYVISILGIDWSIAMFISAVVLLGSMLLFFASIHTLEDYRKARVLSIEGYLRKVSIKEENDNTKDGK
jgi:hypothetical protein